MVVLQSNRPYDHSTPADPFLYIPLSHPESTAPIVIDLEFSQAVFRSAGDQESAVDHTGTAKTHTQPRNYPDKPAQATNSPAYTLQRHAPTLATQDQSEMEY